MRHKDKELPFQCWIFHINNKGTCTMHYLRTVSAQRRY